MRASSLKPPWSSNRRWRQFTSSNVKEGDCSIIEHNSGHNTVIDVCNAKPIEPVEEALMATMAKSERGISGNFQQKTFPVNPISYMNDRGISSIFRYVQTHPDMDHMDGIEALFDEFSPTNFWDTGNTKEMQWAYRVGRALHTGRRTGSSTSTSATPTPTRTRSA